MAFTSGRIIVFVILSLALILTGCDSGGGMSTESESGDLEVTVRGTVTSDSTGNPVEGTEVTIAGTSGEQQFGSATTGTEGDYEASFSVSEGDAPAQLRIEADAEGFLPVADTVDFNQSVTKDIALTEAVQSEVSGQVLDEETESGISNVTVVGTDGGGSELFETTTSSNGQYSASLELAKEPSQVVVEVKNEDYEGARKTASFASTVSLDFTLNPKIIGVLVSGSVTSDSDGDPIEDATVESFPPDEEAPLSDTVTASDGSYELSFSVDAPRAPDELRIAVSNAFGHEDQTSVVAFDSSLNANFSLATVPIEIGTLEDLQKVGDDPKYPLDRRYMLVNDIDASATSTLNGGEGFKPIGNRNNPFEGSLDGNGFTISDLSINRSGEAVGLFGAIGEGGSVSDLRMVGSDLSGLAVGSVAGVVTEGGSDSDIKVKDIYVEGNISNSGDSGGIFGEVEFISSEVNNRTNVLIDSSYSEVSISGNSSAGGIVGNIEYERTEITNSQSHGNILGRSSVGGLVGRNIGIIHNSFATGNVSGNRFDTGGLVGENESGGEISSSYATGDVDGDEGVGGLVGRNDGFQSTVESSYSEGGVSGNSQVGGFVGRNIDEATIEESYTAGDVTGNTEVGGFAGTNDTQSTINTSFWDTRSTGQEGGVGNGTSDGITGLTTDKMQGQSAEDNMSGFDFENTWQVVTDSADYPILFWQD